MSSVRLYTLELAFYCNVPFIPVIGIHVNDITGNSKLDINASCLMFNQYFSKKQIWRYATFFLFHAIVIWLRLRNHCQSHLIELILGGLNLAHKVAENNEFLKIDLACPFLEV